MGSGWVSGVRVGFGLGSGGSGMASSGFGLGSGGFRGGFGLGSGWVRVVPHLSQIFGLIRAGFLFLAENHCHGFVWVRLGSAEFGWFWLGSAGFQDKSGGFGDGFKSTSRSTGSGWVQVVLAFSIKA